MLRSYLRSALRHLVKHSAFTLINISGLAIGLAASLLIFLHVSTELSYDRQFQEADNIYRLAVLSTMGDNQFEAAVTGGPLAQTLQQELPEVTGHTRVREGRLTLLSAGDRVFYEENILFADSNFFQLFDFEFSLGNPHTALREPRSLVLTESMASKFFGSGNPLGQSIVWNNDQHYTVTGVIHDPVHPSHLKFDLLVSFCSLYENQRFKNLLQSYFAYTTLNYILVEEGVDPQSVEYKIQGVVDKYMGDDLAEFGGKYEVFLQSLTHIYLHSDLLHEMKTSSDITRVYIFSGIAVLILIIAAINFINLSTARSLSRAKEVGLRKVFGADRMMVFRQYMIESLLTVAISGVLAVVFVHFLLPLFNRYTGNEFSFVGLFGFRNSLLLLLGLLVLGFLSGIYPSLFLSAYRPVVVLRKFISGGKTKAGFRNALVVIQFMISVFLLAGTFLINKQLDYLENSDLGLDQDNVVVLSLRNADMLRNYPSLKAEMTGIPGVLNATGSSAYLGHFEQRRGFYKEGGTLDDMVLILNVQVDANYLDFYDTRMKQGRNFFENSKTDSNAVVINEAYRKQLLWENPIGKLIYIPGGEGESGIPLKIVGVVDNFHFASLHEEVKPLIVMHAPAQIRYLSLKIDSDNSEQVLSMIGSKWSELFPDYPFEYSMQDSVYEEMYRSEFNMGSLFRIFSVLALFIAVLGLLGLSSYSVEQRTREIGIRKVLGSTLGEILLRITFDFSKWVLLAIVIAVPVTYFAMDRWLNHFAFHTTITWEIFILSAALAFLVAYVTIFLQAYKASGTNPVDSLKYE